MAELNVERTQYGSKVALEGCSLWNGLQCKLSNRNISLFELSHCSNDFQATSLPCML